MSGRIKIEDGVSFLDKYAPSLVSAIILGLILWAGSALLESKSTLGEVKLELRYLNDNLNKNYIELDKRVTANEERIGTLEKYTYENSGKRPNYNNAHKE